MTFVRTEHFAVTRQ